MSLGPDRAGLREAALMHYVTRAQRTGHDFTA
jgi:hypothetical protein